MEKAAVKIQAGFRGFKARKEIKYYTVFFLLSLSPLSQRVIYSGSASHPTLTTFNRRLITSYHM